MIIAQLTHSYPTYFPHFMWNNCGLTVPYLCFNFESGMKQVLIYQLFVPCYLWFKPVCEFNSTFFILCSCYTLFHLITGVI